MMSTLVDLYVHSYIISSADSGQDSKSETTACTVAEQLSSLSDSTSSTGDSGVPHKYVLDELSGIIIYTVNYSTYLIIPLYIGLRGSGSVALVS